MSEPKSTGRKPGFNSSPEGFVAAPPVKPTAPTSAPRFPDGTLVTAENRGFEGGLWEAQHAQFSKALEVRKLKKANVAKALEDYQRVAKAYSNSITTGEGEELNPEAKKLGLMVSEVFSRLVDLRPPKESVNAFMERILKEQKESMGLFDPKDDAETIETLALLEYEYEEAASAYANMFSQEKYATLIRTEEALTAYKKEMAELDYLRKRTLLESSLDTFEKNICPLPLEEILDSTDDKEVDRIRKEFWSRYEDYTASIEALSLFLSTNRENQVEKLKSLGHASAAEILNDALVAQENWLAGNKHNVQEEILKVLQENVASFDIAFDKATTHSEQAESEEACALGDQFEVVKKELKDFTESLNK